MVELTNDEVEILHNMVDFCVNHDYCMGMDSTENRPKAIHILKMLEQRIPELADSRFTIF